MTPAKLRAGAAGNGHVPPTGRESMETMLIRVRVISDRNATAASVVMLGAGDEEKEFTGSAKRIQGDGYDEDTATALAVGRAVEKLAAYLIHRGNARVNTAALRKHKQDRARARAVFASRGARLARRNQSRRLMPLVQILERYGEEAMQRAADRRGETVYTEQLHAPSGEDQ